MTEENLGQVDKLLRISGTKTLDLQKTSPRKELSLFDSTCIIVGIIIGAGIYETAPTVAASVGSSIGTLASLFC